MEPLTLVVNPGSASRKYSVYASHGRLLSAHYENTDGSVALALCRENDEAISFPNVTHNLEEAAEHFVHTLQEHGIELNHIAKVCMRVVLPSANFLDDQLFDEHTINRIRDLASSAPLHSASLLSEYELFRRLLPNAKVIGISDSNFHRTKRDTAWNYGINLEVADTHDIKRFGYHGISVESSVESLKSSGLLSRKTVVCHLGSGSSVTALLDGVTIDTTMGYSPLEGLVMATRSGSIDFVAARAMARALTISLDELEASLNLNSGLLGVSGISSDIRELLSMEHDYRASLALRMYVSRIQQSIGAMSAELGGLDCLVFTGTVGERSSIIRERIVQNLSFLGASINDELNDKVEPASPVPQTIHDPASQVVIVVSRSDESAIMAKKAELID